MAWILIGTFIALILVRVPVSIAIGAATVLTFATSDFSSAMQIIPQQMLEGVNKASLTAVRAPPSPSCAPSSSCPN